MSLRTLLTGTIAMSFVNVVRLLAQFIAIPVISRLLSPTDYGTVAIAMPFILFAMLFADAGIGMSLVRVPLGQRTLWSTCFWLSLLCGIGMSGMMVLAAPIPALLYAQPALKGIVAALSIAILAQAACAIPKAAMQQSGHFKLIAACEITALLASIGTAVFVALRGGGAWVLVDQQLVFFILRAVLISGFSSFRPLVVLDLRNVGEHLRFGHNVIWISIIEFATQVGENFIIGNALGTAAVGVYSMAFQFARLPVKLVSNPLQYVLYAHLAKIRGDGQAIRDSFLAVTRIVGAIVLPSVGMVAAAHGPVFDLLLSHKWASAGEVFMIVAPAAALQVVMAVGGTARMALGRADIVRRTAAEFFGVWMATLLFTVRFGLQGVALSYTAASLLYSPRALMLVLPVLGCSVRVYLLALLGPCLATFLGIAVFVECNAHMALGPLVQLALGGTLGALAVGAGLGVQRARLLEELGSVRQAMHSSQPAG